MVKTQNKSWFEIKELEAQTLIDDKTVVIQVEINGRYILLEVMKIEDYQNDVLKIDDKDPLETIKKDFAKFLKNRTIVDCVYKDGNVGCSVKGLIVAVYEDSFKIELDRAYIIDLLDSKIKPYQNTKIKFKDVIEYKEITNEVKGNGRKEN